MTFFSDLPGMLAFRTRAIRAHAHSALTGRATLTGGLVFFCVGFLSYALVRNSVYAHLPELLNRKSGLIASFFDLHLIRTLLFLMLIYIPTAIILSNSIAGRELGFSVSRMEYRSHASTLLVLWGMLYIIAAPVQVLVPHFLIIGMFEISFGMLLRSILMLVYTLWAIKQLNNLSTMQSLAVFALSLFTLPLYYLLIAF
jgi:hypothetical protein